MARSKIDPLAELLPALESRADSKRAVGEKKYLKSDLCFLGVTVPKIRKVAKEFAKAPLLRDDLVAITEAAWMTDVHELRSVSIALLALRNDAMQAKDIRLLERLLNKANTWAHVDWLAISVAGPLVERYATVRKRLDRWATHENFWLRRSALLALLEPLRRGEGDFLRFERYASPMLQEKEFFIRKAIGWVLREVSKKKPELTAEFVNRHRTQLSGLSYREGTRRLSSDWKKKLQ
jgi:3-methyladenine DNA glycosylase AlkD